MKQKVYLAGGFRSEWQEQVKKLDGFIWLDPRAKERGILLTVEEYSTWDFHFVRQSDIVLVYVEKTNPSCIGLAAECGYAKGLGKTVILILEPNHETIKDSYLQFLTKTADITFDSLEKGMAYLKTFAEK